MKASAKFLSLLFFATSLSGCFGDQEVVRLERISEPMTWIEAAHDRELQMVAEPARYLDSRGNVVDGHRVWSPGQGPLEEIELFYPAGPDEGAFLTRFGGWLFAYTWHTIRPNEIGFYLIGKDLYKGATDISTFGDRDVKWSVESVRDGTVVVNWTILDEKWDDRGRYIVSTFENGRPIPVTTEIHRDDIQMHSTRNLESYSVVEKRAVSVRPLPPVQFAPGDKLFDLWPGHPFPFETAEQLWRTDERWSKAQEWFAERPAGRLVHMKHSIIDENDGNATVFWWDANYLDDRDLLTVSVGWRITHPTAEMRADWPLYDQCPDGCVDPYTGEPRNATSDDDIAPPEWPEQTISIGSAIERFKAINGRRPLTGIGWESFGALDTTPRFDGAHLVLYMDRITSIWDPTPDLPEALGGNLQRISHPGALKIEQNLETGVLKRIQTDHLIY